MKIIGIDPDIDKCGVCLLKDGEIAELISMDTATLIRHIIYGDFLDCKIAVENTLKTSAIYTKNRRQQSKVNEKIALSVGKVQGVTKILIDVIEQKYGEKPLLVPVGVGKQIKNNAKLFRELTGWEGSTNEDKRDAYAIAIYANKKLALNHN